MLGIHLFAEILVKIAQSYHSDWLVDDQHNPVSDFEILPLMRQTQTHHPAHLLGLIGEVRRQAESTSDQISELALQRICNEIQPSIAFPYPEIEFPHITHTVERSIRCVEFDPAGRAPEAMGQLLSRLGMELRNPLEDFRCFRASKGGMIGMPPHGQCTIAGS